MWTRDFVPPAEALALFQVYDRFAPLTPYQGYIWRYQVEEPVRLELYLLPGSSRDSYLERRRAGRWSFRAPLLRMQGQLDSLEAPAALPLQDWLIQGLSCWLRSLGSTELTPPLRFALSQALLEIETDSPLLELLAYHPLVPLCNGEWISLELLRRCGAAWGLRPAEGEILPGWIQNLPLLYAGDGYAGWERLLGWRPEPVCTALLHSLAKTLPLIDRRALPESDQRG